MCTLGASGKARLKYKRRDGVDSSTTAIKDAYKLSSREMMVKRDINEAKQRRKRTPWK